MMTPDLLLRQERDDNMSELSGTGTGSHRSHRERLLNPEILKGCVDETSCFSRTSTAPKEQFGTHLLTNCRDYSRIICLNHFMGHCGGEQRPPQYEIRTF